MSALPLTDTATKRRIGDILLAHGFVSEEALADAAAEQERTSQPLGQILVQHGAITRLELASALAEQWSDPSASISLLPLPAPGRPPNPQPHDDAQYAARLQGAVADLARRVHSSQPLEEIDERVTDLSQQIEATLARTQRIEAAVATLAESLEGVTGGVEDAFVALQTGSAGLAVDLARIDQKVGELATRFAEPPPQDPVLSARLVELAAAVEALAGRPVIDDTVRGRVEELGSRLETLVDGAALDDLRGALRELEGRPSGDPEVEARLERVEALATEGVPRAELEGHAALLAGLQVTLSELEARPVGSPEIDARLERIEALLAETVTSEADTTAVDALAFRVEVAAGAQEGLVSSIEALGARLEEFAGHSEQVDGIASRLDSIETRLSSDLVTTGDLSKALDRARDEPNLAAAESDGRIEELTQALDTLRAELSGSALPLASDTALSDQMGVLTARVEQLAADGADHDSIAAKLEAVETRRASDLDTIDALGQAIDGIRHELASAPATPSSDAPAANEVVARLDQRLSMLEALGARVDQLAEAVRAAAPVEPVQAPEGLRAEVDRRIDELGRTLDERLAAIEAPASRATDQPVGLESDLERVRMSIERVGLHLGEHDRALAELMRSRGVAQQLDELSARIDEVAATRTVGGAATGSERTASDVSTDMRALMRRVDDSETSSQADREKLMSRLERMASSIDWRLQRLETGDAE